MELKTSFRQNLDKTKNLAQEDFKKRLSSFQSRIIDRVKKAAAVKGEATLKGEEAGPKGDPMGRYTRTRILTGVSENFFRLLEESPPLLESIMLGKYNLIVGEGASSRIPTLIMNKFVNEIYKEKGHKKPGVVFVSGPGAGKDDENPEISEKRSAYFKNYLQQKKMADMDINALVVTEEIGSGKSLEVLISALQKNNINYEIAALAGISKETKNRLKEKLNVWVYAPQKPAGSSIYNAPYLAGVVKGFNKIELKKVYGVQETVSQARKDADFVAAELVEEFKGVKFLQTTPKNNGVKEKSSPI